MFQLFNRGKGWRSAVKMEELKVMCAIGWCLAIISPFVWRMVYNWDDEKHCGRLWAINFILGLFVGAVVGLLIAALIRAND